MQNLHNVSNSRIKRWWGGLTPNKKRVWAVLFSVGAVVITLLLVALTFGLIYLGSFKTVYAEGMAAKTSLDQAQVFIKKQDFDHATEALEATTQHFSAAYAEFQTFNTYQFIPGVGTQIKTMDHLLLAGKNLTSGASKLTNLAVKMNSVIAEKEGDVTFADISTEDKHELLKTLQESSPDLVGVKADIELAVLLIEEIPEEGLLKPIKDALAPVKQQLPLLEALISQVIPAAQSLPTIAGYPTEKTYLFLLQNNRELRPTGGFIGTYGVLKVKDGEIVTFTTEDVYNLDLPAQDIVTEVPPGPMAHYLNSNKWFFRDINWSPDFPTTAQKAESKYHEEGGPEAHFDGVIAVTPSFIESLLLLTGPIKAGGIEFTDKNFFEKLETQVEFGYYEQGIDLENRKDIIAELSKNLMDEVFGLPKSRFQDLWETFVANVDEKQILIYLDDPLTQQLVIEENWAGEMKEYSSDYLQFVDANLAALKTDEKMKRHVTYTVAKENGKYIGVAEMKYTNTTTSIGKLYTRYRTYTRIYVPKGSELLSHEGFLTTDRYLGGVAATPEVVGEYFTRPDGEQIHYTVISGFVSIEPKQEQTIKVKYTLPDSVQQQIEAGSYDLYVQKQAGTIEHGLTVNIQADKKIDQATPFDFLKPTGDNNVSFEANLQTDREFHVEFK